MTDRDGLLDAVKAANPLPVDVPLPTDMAGLRLPVALLIADAGVPEEGVGSRVVTRPRGWRGPAVATAVMALILLLAGVAGLVGRQEPARERDAFAPAMTAAAVRPPVCDLFTEEDLTRIVRDAYLAAGRSSADEYMPTHLVESTRGGGDSCDWLEPRRAWVILERLRDARQIPEWAKGGFYQTTADQAFAAHPAMPAGVEVSNVLVRRGYEGDGMADVWVSVDVQIVDDAPEWWRFNIDIGLDDFVHTSDTGLAEEIAWGVARPVFEHIESGS
jgi:hypothetical protein